MATTTAKKRSKKSAKKTAKRPTAKVSKRAETGVLDFDGRYADYAAAHARPCPTCGARAGKDCVVEGTTTRLPDVKIGNALIAGMHAARRTLELKLGAPAKEPQASGVRIKPLPEEHHGQQQGPSWEDLWEGVCEQHGLTVEAPTLKRVTHAPWLRVRSLIDGADIVGYATETVYGASVTVHGKVDPPGGQFWGVAVGTLDLSTARWWTTREDIEAGLIEAGYGKKQVRELIQFTGWTERTKRAKAGKVRDGWVCSDCGAPVTSLTECGACGSERGFGPSWAGLRSKADPCLECEHPECPIVPDCSGCPTCAAARAAINADAKIESAEARITCALEEVAPRDATIEAGAEGPGSSAPADSSSSLVVTLDRSLLRRDGGTQPRAQIDPVVVEEYAEAYRSKKRLPPLVAFFDGEWHWLADGFHRDGALELAGITFADVEVRQGTRRDAVLYSCGANASHGLRRTRADRRRAVETLLRDEEWGRCTDRWIAERCGVSPTTVGTIRAELVGSGEVSKLDTREGRDGKAYTVPEREPSSTAEPDASRDPRGDASSVGEGAAPEDEGPPRLWRCSQTGRKQCSWCGARWPDEVLPGFEGEPPASCPKCQVRAPELRDPGDEELVRAAEAWTAKRRRGEVPELDPPVSREASGDASREYSADASSGAGERIEPGDGSHEDPRPPDGSRSDPGGSLDDPPRTAKRSWREVLELPPGRIDPMAIVEHHVRLSSVIGLTDEERAELDRARAVGLSQWHTLPDLADYMVELLGLAKLDRPCVLEPSAGAGALIAAVRRACGRDAHVTAHEIDPVYAELLRKAPPDERADVVHDGDFLASAIPSRPYDATLMNSPYEGGADGAFLERAMASSLRIGALCRLNVTTGVDRYDRVWSRVESGEWRLVDEVNLVRRPDFIGPGEDSAKSDYVVLHLAHHTVARSALTQKRWLR